MRSLLVLLLLGLAGLARAETPNRPYVFDNVGLFKQTAVDDANKRIAAIRKEYGADLVVETFAQLPPETAAEKRAWWKARERNRALKKWAQDMADRGGMAPNLYSAVWAWSAPRSTLADVLALAVYLAEDPMNRRVNGLYVAIFHGATSGQRDVRVVAWPAQWDKKISWVKQDALRKLLARELSQDPDNALWHAVERFAADMRDIQDLEPSPIGLGWPWRWGAVVVVLLLVGGLVGAWLVLLVVRYSVARRSSPAKPSSLYPPAMQGALFGVPAAFWVHDKLFRYLPVEQAPPEPPPVAAPPPAAQTPPGDENTGDQGSG
jgi:hypothetical protein